MAIAVLCLAALAVAPHPAVAFTTIPNPSAGWHGRAIARPHDPLKLAAPARSIAAEGWRAGPVRRGTGVASSTGSRRVREVQHRLRRLGYRPGRPDGRFGPRTEAAVRWFQIKHGIPAVGSVGTGTLQHLRQRTGPGATAAEPGTRIPEPSSPAEPTATPEPPSPAATPAPIAPEPASSTTPPAWTWPAGLLAAALLVVGVLGGRRRQRKPQIVAVTWPLWAEGRSRDDAVERFGGWVRAVAVPRRDGTEVTHYLVAQHGRPEPFWVTTQEVDRLTPPPAQRPTPAATSDDDEPLAIGYVLVPAGPHATTEAGFCERVGAIEAECRRRGWRLDQIVRDLEPARGTPGDARRGFIHALERIADAEAQAFVVAELQHLTRSASELSTLLEWFSDSDATLVALDVGLDTASPASAPARRAIASVGAWERERQLRPEQSDLLERVVRMRAEGIPIDAIARVLTSEPAVPARGGPQATAEVHSLADAHRLRRRPIDRGPRRGRSA